MNDEISISRYTAADKAAWDKFVSGARNGMFLFRRDYMDYHADRFADHSLMCYQGKRLMALLPAHEKDHVLISHAGLTYGSFIVDERATTAWVCDLFSQLNHYLWEHQFTKAVYRPVPRLFHTLPTEEDLYALWLIGAKLVRRLSCTAIDLSCPLPWRKDHRRRLDDAREAGVRVEAGGRLADFWPVLEANLKARFGSKPVHTLAEIELLQSRFPKEIIQYNAFVGDEIVGGLTFYIIGNVLHGQYSSTTPKGKEVGAMEAIYHQVMNHDFTTMRYLDFGSSNEQEGRYLNRGLIGHKEGYGGRTYCADSYEFFVSSE